MADCLDQQIRAPMLEAICLGSPKKPCFAVIATLRPALPADLPIPLGQCDF